MELDGIGLESAQIVFASSSVTRKGGRHENQDHYLIDVPPDSTLSCTSDSKVLCHIIPKISHIKRNSLDNQNTTNPGRHRFYRFYRFKIIIREE